MKIIDQNLANNNLDILKDKIEEEKTALQPQQDKAPPKPDSNKLDPTFFGDWQINCRTIDF